MEELRASPSRGREKMTVRRVAMFSVAGLVVLWACQICLAKGHVLIYTKNGKGFVHDNIPASVECLKGICAQSGWTYEVSDSPGVFTRDKIRQFDVLVFSNTNNETFDSNDQREVFQGYIRNGGGFVGIHSACGSERTWPWFWANLGGRFVRHPALQRFDIKVIDSNHPSTRFLGPVWKWEDECYYLNNLNPDIHVLLAADLTTVKDEKKKEYPGEIFGSYFPLCWCHEYEGGRQWYTAHGHLKTHYEDENFKRHLAAGMAWAMRKGK